MKGVKFNTLNAKVRRCRNCQKKNILSSKEVIWKPFSGYYDERGGYHYFICSYCKSENKVSEKAAKKLKT